MISSASALSFCPDTLPHGPPCRWETCLGATGWKSAKVTPPTPLFLPDNTDVTALPKPSGGLFSRGWAALCSSPVPPKLSDPLCWRSGNALAQGLGPGKPPFPRSPLDRTCPALASQGDRIQGTAAVPGPGVHVQVPGLLEDCLVYLTRN